MRVPTFTNVMLPSLIICLSAVGADVSTTPENVSNGTAVTQFGPITDAELREGLSDSELARLEELIPHGKEHNARFDLTEDELSRATSAQLVQHYLTSPMPVAFGLYSKSEIGLYRAYRESATLTELLERDDFVDGFIAFYANTKKAITNPDSTQRTSGAISLSLMHADHLLLYAPLFKRTAGHERRLLAELVDLCRTIADLNAKNRARTGEDLYNNPIHLCLHLLKRIDPDGFSRWDADAAFIKDEHAFLEYVALQVNT
ncbi:MAG: hypothetical protein HUU46_12100 [Candidatus Hydrogenedentes bacterium]|nr:hypothetical protein [Candidatus Hydrogenedentota bacterium]